MRLKKIISIILTVSIVSTSFPLIVQAGEQTEEETVSQVTQVVEEIEDKTQTVMKPAYITAQYHIYNTDDFDRFMTTSKYHADNYEVILMNDIDMGGKEYSPIYEFNGKLDGKGKTISNISCQGFVVHNNGTIANLNLEGGNIIHINGNGDDVGFVYFNHSTGEIESCYINMNASYDKIISKFVGVNNGTINDCRSILNIKGQDNMDAVVGFVHINNGTIKNCMTSGNTTGNRNVAGFGYENNGKITECTSGDLITGKQSVAGFIIINNGEISTCTTLSDINGKNEVAGFAYLNNLKGAISDCTVSCETITGDNKVAGFVCLNETLANITKCNSEGNLIGNNFVGGFVCENKGKITDSTATGSVTGRGDNIGGLVGNNEGEIIDCTAEGAIIGQSIVGGLVGDNKGNGRISNSKATGNVTGRGDNIGGLAGNNEGLIYNCTAEGTIIGQSIVGGLAGDNKGNGRISNSKATGNVTGRGDNIGGLAGNNETEIINCTAEGAIIGQSIVGGLVGYNNATGKINDSTATGNLNGVNFVGGLIGKNAGIISDCTALGQANGRSYLGGFGGSNTGNITKCTAMGNVTGTSYLGGFFGDNGRGGHISYCASEGEVCGFSVLGGFGGSNSGYIGYSQSSGNVRILNNGFFSVIGNGKELDKKDVVLGTIIAMMLGGAIGGVALKTVGVDKTISSLKSMLESMKNYFNEKVMTNSNYKKIIGALTILVIAAIVIIIPVSLSKKKHTYNAIGGFGGKNDGKIENCTSSGKVTVKGAPMPIEVGGFAGQNGITGEIINCSAEVEVNVSTKSSGKAGGFAGNNNGRICRSKYIGRRVYLSTGKLYKDDCCGGFAGKNSIGGVIDGCEVGGVNVETKSNVKRGAVILETKNKTKGGGILGVAGKGSVTINCECKARRKTKIGEVVAKVCYKTENRSILKNNKVY